MNTDELNLTKKILKTLSYDHIFSDDVLQKASLLSLPTKEQLFFSGDNYDALYCILKGKAFVTSYSESGSKIIVDTLPPGTFFGDIELYSFNYHSLHNVVAVPNTTVLKFPLQIVKSTLNKDIKFLNFMCQKLTEKLLVTSSNYSTSLLLSAKNKLARYLLNQLELNQSTTFNFSIKGISEVLGSSDRHIRRLMTELETEGILVRSRSTVTLLNIERIHSLIN